MNIYNTADFRELEHHTITEEGISFAQLMDRAIDAFCRWFMKKVEYEPGETLVIAGPGNNGGDAIGVAGNLHKKGYDVTLLLIKLGNTSELHQKQLNKYKDDLDIRYWEPGSPIDIHSDYDSIIEGVFGYGLNRPLSEDLKTFVKYINDLNARLFSIDIPSGLYADLVKSNYSFMADYTLTFHSPKASFFLAENADYVGKWEAVSINLRDDNFIPAAEYYTYYTAQLASANMPVRKTFDHKGTYGNNLLIAGQSGMAGCAILAAKANLRSGAGKLTIHCPSGMRSIIQVGVPEAMVSIDKNTDYLSTLPDLTEFDVIGVGPGIGTRHQTAELLLSLLEKSTVPLILDADALNILSNKKDWPDLLKKEDIILPHPGEFDRLFGKHASHLKRIKTVKKISEDYPFTIVLKGAYSIVAQSGKPLSFNSTGNPGMGTAGSGDVLTGIITSLVGQGLSSFEAARLGVYLHGLAGDIYADKYAMPSLIAGDLSSTLGLAIKFIQNIK